MQDNTTILQGFWGGFFFVCFFCSNSVNKSVKTNYFFMENCTLSNECWYSIKMLLVKRQGLTLVSWIYCKSEFIKLQPFVDHTILWSGKQQKKLRDFKQQIGMCFLPSLIKWRQSSCSITVADLVQCSAFFGGGLLVYKCPLFWWLFF